MTKPAHTIFISSEDQKESINIAEIPEYIPWFLKKRIKKKKIKALESASFEIFPLDEGNANNDIYWNSISDFFVNPAAPKVFLRAFKKLQKIEKVEKIITCGTWRLVIKPREKEDLEEIYKKLLL